jgi:hypothetical protein
MLVGNKCDMANKREVEKSEGETVAKQLGCEFLETSAKTCINVEQGPFSLLHVRARRPAYTHTTCAHTAFYSVVRQIRRKRLPAQKKAGAKGGKGTTRKGCMIL